MRVALTAGASTVPSLAGGCKLPRDCRIVPPVHSSRMLTAGMFNSFELAGSGTTTATTLQH
jgi:hypothetical protein